MIHRKRSPLRAREIAIVGAIGLASLAVVSALIWANIRWSRLAPGGGYFYTGWAGARAFLFRSQDPYGAAIAIAAQELAYGGGATNGTGPFWLDLPFFLLPLYFPFALISDPAAARGVWAFFGELAVVATILVSARLIDWHPPRAFLLVFSLLLIFSLVSLPALADGNPSVFLGLAYVGTLCALHYEREELAGALVAFALCKWEVGLPFLLLVAWRVFHERRWRVLAGFAMSLVLLLGLSFLIYPGWPLPFLTASVGMIRSPHGVDTSAAFHVLSPQSGSQIAQGLTILVLGTLIFEWAVSRESDFRSYTWLCCLALAATPLIGARSGLSNLVVLAPGLVLITAAALQRPRWGAWFGLLLPILAFVVPWFLARHWLALEDQQSLELIFIFLPCVVVIGLYWTRWWFLRPARTWLDDVRAARH